MAYSAIAKLYADKCENRGLNFNSVPKSKQKEVQAIIIEDGYEIIKDGTVVKIEEVTE